MNKKLVSLFVITGIVAAFLTMTGCFGSGGDEGGIATKILKGIANNSYLTSADVTGFYCYVQDKNGHKQNIASGLPTFTDTTTGRYTVRVISSIDYDNLPHVYFIKYKLLGIDKMMLNVQPDVKDGQDMSMTPATTIASMALLNTGAGMTGADLSTCTTVDGMISAIATKLEGSNFNATTITEAVVSQAQATVAARLGFADSNLDCAASANTATGLGNLCTLANMVKPTLMDEVAKIAIPTSTFTMATITSNATLETTTASTTLTGNTAVITDSDLYPHLTVTAINSTSINMGAPSSGIVTATGLPTFDIPHSASDVTPVFNATLNTTGNTKDFSTSLTVVLYTATNRATVELSTLSYNHTTNAFTVPDNAKVTISYKNDGATGSSTYTNVSSNLFTVSSHTVSLNLSSTMAAALFNTINGKITNNATYTYNVVFGSNMYSTAKYNTICGSIKYVQKNLSSIMIEQMFQTLSLKLANGTTGYDLSNVMVFGLYTDDSSASVTPTWTKTSGVGTVSGSTYTWTTIGDAVLTATYGGQTATVTVGITAGPNAVSTFVALPWDSVEIDLYCKTPTDLNGGTQLMVRRSTTSAPASATAGTFVWSREVDANLWYGFTAETGLTGGTTYYYSAFVINATESSAAASATAKPNAIQSSNNSTQQFLSTTGSSGAAGNRVYALSVAAGSSALLCGRTTITAAGAVPLFNVLTEDPAGTGNGGVKTTPIKFYIAGHLCTSPASSVVFNGSTQPLPETVTFTY
ncbi:MAG: hypothetical protein PHW04_01365 [Candidatus Wallbacteria bacterium]|nr:hypothetical protein [Candidatus Wallbacteria bacterium]